MVAPLGDLLTFLSALLRVPGSSGAEHPAAEWLRGQWAPLADEVGSDRLGNTWAVRRGESGPGPDGHRPLLLLAAHLDVIGLIITRVGEGGFAHCAPVGGIDRRALLGQPVIIQGRREVPAVVATIPPHLTTPEERRHVPPFDRIVLDTGLDSGALAELVGPGDRARFAAPVSELLGERLAAPGLDDRAGVAVLYQALYTIERHRLEWDVAVLANVQEEVGLRGIASAGRRLEPNAAVVVDVGFGAQPGVDEHVASDLGGGPVLAFGPSLHRGLTLAIEGCAKAIGLPLQREAVPAASGTDAWALQLTGTAVGLVSIPLRCMHTPAETVDLADIRRAGQLLGALADSIAAAGVGWTQINL